MRSFTYFKIALLLLFFSTCKADFLDDWDPKSIQGTIQNQRLQNGPVVANLDTENDNNLEKEVIVVTSNRLSVFEYDGTQRFSFNCPDENNIDYNFRYITAVGEVVKDDNHLGSEIVVLSYRVISNTTLKGYIYILDKDDGSIICKSDNEVYGPGIPDFSRFGK